MTAAVFSDNSERDDRVYTLRKAFGDLSNSPLVRHYEALPENVLSEAANRASSLRAQFRCGGLLAVGFGYAAVGSWLLDAKGSTTIACAAVAAGIFVNAVRAYRAQDALKAQLLNHQ